MDSAGASAEREAGIRIGSRVRAPALRGAVPPKSI
jgi:hypothetical protein